MPATNALLSQTCPPVASRRLHVEIHVEANALRGWHRVLLERLAMARNHTTAVVVSEGARADALHRLGIEALLALDRTICNLPKSPLAERCPATALGRSSETRRPADVVLDLTADGRVARRDGSAWRLLYDGEPGEPALVSSLLQGRAPVASVEGPAGIRVAARLGTDWHGLFRARLEDALARTITVLVAAVEGAGSTAVPGMSDEAANLRQMRLAGRRSNLVSAAAALRSAVAIKAGGTLSRGLRWRVAWRSPEKGRGILTAGRPSDEDWRVLPDDGRRFYADPFPIVHEGRLTLFVEEYAYATRRGVISAVSFGRDGPEGSPEVVLAEAYHLSYPFVFAEEDALWMVPESGSNRTIDLYRADVFPRRWTKVATLVCDVTASDATLLRHGGRWWLFATVKDIDGMDGPSGSCSDALHVWWAPHFSGPWTSHRSNPVLIDAGSARPAGRFIREAGTLVRPAQDCRRAYGGALVFARIDRLDLNGFEQTVTARVEPGRSWSRRGLHTFNQAGGLEFVDGFG